MQTPTCAGEGLAHRRGRAGGGPVALAAGAAGQRVLDLGTVTAFVLDLIGPTGEVVGIDRRGPLLGMARERLGVPARKKSVLKRMTIGPLARSH
jgi:hypothetical protein